MNRWKTLLLVVGLMSVVVAGWWAMRSGWLEPPRRIEVVYLWSPTMPLSQKGIPHIEAAAANLGARLRLIQAEEMSRVLPGEELEGLVEAGATVHYPSVTLGVDGEWVGNAITGYKNAEAWQALLELRLDSPHTHFSPISRIEGRPDSEMRLAWTLQLEPWPGAFFRQVPGTSLVAFDREGVTHLLDRKTGLQHHGPGWIDFVPSPDGRIFVTPADDDAGLEVYDAVEVIDRALDGEGILVAPRFLDPELDDHYPSVGILENDESAGRVRYRVLVAHYRSLAFRDYDVTWDGTGELRVDPLLEPRPACTGHDLSLPILSPNGREIVARLDDEGSTRIYRLHDDATCTELADLGVQGGKAGFSPDSSAVAYASPIGDGARSQLWVYDRASGDRQRIAGAQSLGLIIPEFLDQDSILMLAIDEHPEAEETAELRMYCCLSRRR